MGYRDDSEAQRAHIEQLERENAELRRQNAELRGASSAPRAHGAAERWLGAPVALRVERVLDAELPSSDHDRIVELLRSALGGVGETSALGSTLAWRIGPPSSQRTIEVTIAAREGTTTIRVIERLGSLAGGLFGGIVGGAGGGGVGVIAPLAAMVDPLLAMVVVPAWVFGVYAIVRSAFGATARSRERQLVALVDEISRVVRASVGDDGNTRVRVALDADALAEHDDAISAEGKRDDLRRA